MASGHLPSAEFIFTYIATKQSFVMFRPKYKYKHKFTHKYKHKFTHKYKHKLTGHLHPIFVSCYTSDFYR